jgi:tetratricopeptide (TPR) repeat protein
MDDALAEAGRSTTSPEYRNSHVPPNISPPPRPGDVRTASAESNGVDGTSLPPKIRSPIGWSTAGAIALLAAILAFVIFVLPGIVERRSTAVVDRPVAEALARAESGPEERIEHETKDPAAVADNARTRYVEQRRRAEAVGAPQWARSDFLNATVRGDNAEAMHSASRFEEAGAAYAEAAAQLTRLIESSPEILNMAIADGDHALEHGDIAAAVVAFRRALLIAPDDPRARRGLRRAEVRHEVDVLLDRGARSEREGDHGAAADAYRSALRLDPESDEARAGAERADRAGARDAFSAAMSKGLAALDDNRFTDARSAFREAGRLAPDAPEVREALLRVDRAERRTNLAVLKRQAEEAEAREDWRTAADLYARVLALDSNLAFAVSGQERSAHRMELSSRIDFHLTHPERLVSDDVLADADAVLAAALEIEPRGPEIDRQTLLLKELVTARRTLVPVPFHSDNLTDVVIHRVGRLGSFISKTLELRPGTYTVVGSRPGYRDVRIQLTVQLGGVVPPVVVRCEESV